MKLLRPMPAHILSIGTVHDAVALFGHMVLDLEIPINGLLLRLIKHIENSRTISTLT